MCFYHFIIISHLNMPVSFFWTHVLAFPSSSATSITCLFLLFSIVDRLDFASPCFSANFVLFTFPCTLTNSSYSWIIFCFCLKSKTFYLIDYHQSFSPKQCWNLVIKKWNESRVSTFVVSDLPCLTHRLFWSVTKAAVSIHPAAIKAMINYNGTKFRCFLYQKTVFVKLRWFI